MRKLDGPACRAARSASLIERAGHGCARPAAPRHRRRFRRLVVATVQTARLAGSPARCSRRASADVRGPRGRRRDPSRSPRARRSGYAILGRQVAREWSVAVAGRAVAVRLRADLILAREGSTLRRRGQRPASSPRASMAPPRAASCSNTAWPSTSTACAARRRRRARAVHEVEFALPFASPARRSPARGAPACSWASPSPPWRTRFSLRGECAQAPLAARATSTRSLRRY